MSITIGTDDIDSLTTKVNTILTDISGLSYNTSNELLKNLDGVNDSITRSKEQNNQSIVSFLETNLYIIIKTILFIILIGVLVYITTNNTGNVTKQKGIQSGVGVGGFFSIFGSMFNVGKNKANTLSNKNKDNIKKTDNITQDARKKANSNNIKFNTNTSFGNKDKLISKPTITTTNQNKNGRGNGKINGRNTNTPSRNISSNLNAVATPGSSPANINPTTNIRPNVQFTPQGAPPITQQPITRV